MPQRSTRFNPVTGASTSSSGTADGASSGAGTSGSAGAAGTTAELLLRLLIPPERQQVLARSMLRASRTASGRFRAVISRTMQHDFHLNGVSRASSEPRDIAQVAKLTGSSDRALASLARTWLVANDELRERVAQQLAPYDITIIEPDLALQGFWETNSAAAALARAQESLGAVDPDDLLLAWSLLTGRMLLAEDERPEQVRALVTTPDEPFPMHPDDIVTADTFEIALWADVVARVSDLADDDPAWGELEQAVDALQRLAHTRQSRREARFAPLRAALAAVQEQPQRVLVDLNITGVAAWAAEQCPPEEIDAIATRVTALALDVTDFADLHTRMQQMARATFAERRDAQQHELEIGDRILTVYGELDAILAAPDGDQPPPPPTRATTKTVGGQPDTHADSSAADDQPDMLDGHGHGHAHAHEEDDASTAAAVQDASPARTEPAAGVRQVLYSVADAARFVLAGTGPGTGTGSAATDTATVEPERATALLWAFVADGDVAAATWVARALQRDELAQALAGVVGGTLATARNRIGHDLAGLHAERIAADAAGPGSDAGQGTVRLLRLAAALRPALLIPHSGMGAWLYQDAETHLPGIDGVIEEMRRLPAQALASPQSDADQRWECERDAKRSVAQAQTLRIQPPGFPFGGGQPLWRQLMQETDLGTVLHGVADDARDARERVRAAAEQWSDVGWRDGEIQRQHRRCSSGHTSADDPFDGRSLHTMQREIGDLLALGAQWLQQVDALDLLDRGGDRFANQSQTQRGRLAQRLPQAYDDLRTLQDRSQPVGLQAAARVLAWSLQDVSVELRLEAAAERAAPLAAAVSERTRRLGSASSLASALGNRINDLPGISLDWHDQPSPDDLRTLPILLARAAQ